MTPPQRTTTTLVVKRIPPSLTPDKQHDFFKKHGALSVRPMRGKDMKGMAFLDFETREAAQLAFQKLDKLYIDTSRKGLTVEYADSSSQDTPPATLSTVDPVPVAADLGFNYASNPHLLYEYPTPTPEIMNNMMNAIATVPRLYTQVLHLMNKMNLPPPFAPTSEAPALLKRKRDELLASDESEIESDKEDEQAKKLQLRRKILRKS